MKLSFIGDIMLGREVGEKSLISKNKIVSKEVEQIISKSKFVVANLEAPISQNIEEDDIMTFIAKPETLTEVDFVDVFSLANNHINDAGTNGIVESIKFLENQNFVSNGFYKHEYEPVILKDNEINCAVICCTDVINIEIDDEKFNRKLLWLDDEIIDKTIVKYKEKGYFVILYVHGGIMFSRYPNPAFRNALHSKIDIGVDSIITVHPHVIGCEETYKGKKIFYSLGDFIMDGHSERRRSSMILNFDLKKDFSFTYELIPTIINNDLRTGLAKGKKKEKLLKSWKVVSEKLAKNTENYDNYYKKRFKIEILLHVISTLKYQIKEKSILDFIKIIYTRAKDFKNMGRWMMKDTSKMRNNLEDKTML
ncbi:CapA family protein [Polaribacter sp. KT 15]|uniref:CapA family protein n=1 Tax=Polaribacter sp. KT 15 TaxID=1896175 RepID=UPI000909C3B6|nr:CapA family protein [Polaribacter sp. KT 15]SHN00966.1 Poly-gamma-glutamate biosynthesis protein CapA/YwtB (capsule formation), metallophosphatase superfamily [Polaribacter sp. KT 15]